MSLQAWLQNNTPPISSRLGSTPEDPWEISFPEGRLQGKLLGFVWEGEEGRISFCPRGTSYEGEEFVVDGVGEKVLQRLQEGGYDRQWSAWNSKNQAFLKPPASAQELRAFWKPILTKVPSMGVIWDEPQDCSFTRGELGELNLRIGCSSCLNRENKVERVEVSVTIDNGSFALGIRLKSSGIRAFRTHGLSHHLIDAQEFDAPELSWELVDLGAQCLAGKRAIGGAFSKAQQFWQTEEVLSLPSLELGGFAPALGGRG